MSEMSIHEYGKDYCPRWPEHTLFRCVQYYHWLVHSTWSYLTFFELVKAEYKYNSSGCTTLCFDTLMGSGSLLSFGGMCQKKDTVCQLWTVLTPKLRQNGLEVILKFHENNVNESLICFFFGFGGMCQNTNARCQLWTTFDMTTKAKWKKRRSGDTKEILRRLGC